MKAVFRVALSLHCAWIGAAGIRAASPTLEEQLEVWAEPELRSWHAPEFPIDLIKDNESHAVRVRFIVGVSGEVESVRLVDGSDPLRGDYAVKTVKKWTFSPALEKGKPVRRCMDAAVVFHPSSERRKRPADSPTAEERPMVSDIVPASAKSMPEGDYPEVLRNLRLPGVARFEGMVTTDGKLVRPRIVSAAHTDFVLPALRALVDWEFTPRMQGDLPVESPVNGEVSFVALDGDVSTADVLKDNGISKIDDSTPLSTLPAPVVAVDTAWPLEMLVNGEGGSAAVDFEVNASGIVTHARVREASTPAVGAALLAAVSGWRFSPARDDGGAVTVGLTKRAAFFPIPREPDEQVLKDPNVRLVLAIRRGEVGTAKGLDEKLAPIYRVPPQYPLALKGGGAPTGKVEIEFVIDRDGRARLPRIVSASREEFGWAAAMAVAQWVFRPPHRNGEAVDVKVRIPFDFQVPAN